MKPAAAELTSDTPGLEIGGCTVFGGLQIVVAEQGEEIPWTPERPDRQAGAAGAEPA